MPTLNSASASARAISDRVEAARAMHATGRSREALEVLSEPSDFSQDLYTLRGDLQLQLGQFHEALGSYSTVIAFERHNMYAQHRLALCLCRLERWELAAEKTFSCPTTCCDQAHIQFSAIVSCT